MTGTSAVPNALISVLLVSVVPLAVALALPRDEHRLRRIVRWLVCFAIGALLGAACLHMIPEAFAGSAGGEFVGLMILVGFFAFFVLERYLGVHHHGEVGLRRGGLPTLAAVNLIGDAIHNLVDGMAIAAAYLAEPALGLTTAIAVLLHEVPQELGDYGVLLHSGLPRRRAVNMNLLSGLVAIAGAILVLVSGQRITGIATALIPFASGGFVYIAASDLIPQLREEPDAPTVGLLLTVAMGAGLTALPLLLHVE